jgi:hypothetical protein
MSSKDFVPFEEPPQKKQGKDPFHQPSKSLPNGVRPSREQWGSFDPRDAPPAKMYAPDERVPWELGIAGSGVYMDTSSGTVPKAEPRKAGQDSTMRLPVKAQEPATPMFPVKSDVKVASARVQGHGAMPESPEQQLHHKFETDVAVKAQGLLKANKDRLNSEQTQYTQDKNPKSKQWQQLWQVEHQRQAFHQHERSLKAQRDAVSLEMQRLSDTPSLTDGLGAMAQDLQNSPKHQQLVKLSEQRQKLELQMQQAKQMQVSLEYAYPVLAAVKGETGENPQDIQTVQQRLPGAFNEIRGDIDTVSRELKKDPSTAVLFDSVLVKALKHESYEHPQKYNELLNWVEQERGKKEGIAHLSQIVGGGLFLASFMPQLRGLAPLLRVIGAGTVGANFAYNLPDLMLLDAAAQAGRGGAGKLTGESPDEARFNLVMGYTNVALAGLDIGFEAGLTRVLQRIPGVVKAAASFTREQSRVFVASLGRIKGEVTDEVVQRIAAAARKADAATTMIVDNGDGTLTAVRPLSKAADKVDDVAARSASRRSAPKAFDAYANASEVKPFIGMKVDPNNLPPGYLYGKMQIGKDEAGNEVYREVVYLEGSDKTKMPLIVDKQGNIQMGKAGEYRIVNDNVYPKAVETIPGKPGKLLGKLSQVHHMYADNMLRSTTFGQRALRLGAVNPDGSINLIELANSTDNLAKGREAFRDAKFSDFIHNTQHPKFDGLMQTVLDDAITEVREAKGLSRMKNENFIPQMTKEEMKAAWDESLARMRRGLMGEDRVLYENILERTRPNKSLAQGESQDNSEVA